MVDIGYIKGVRVEEGIAKDLLVDADDIRITLKGLEFLQENSIMQRLYKAAKGIKARFYIAPLPLICENQSR